MTEQISRRDFLKTLGAGAVGASLTSKLSAFEKSNVTAEFLKKLDRYKELFFDEYGNYEKYGKKGPCYIVSKEEVVLVNDKIRKIEYSVNYPAERIYKERDFGPGGLEKDAPLVFMIEERTSSGSRYQTMIEDTNLDGDPDKISKNYGGGPLNVSALEEHLRRDVRKKFVTGLKNLSAAIDKKVANYIK